MSAAPTHRNDRQTSRVAAWLLSFLLYIVIVLLFGERLGISNNYFVIIPLIVAALVWGTAGGIAIGILGLPANLALFALIGHPEYAPENLIIAESTGVIIGTALGLLGTRYRYLGEEIQRRHAIEATLRATLDERNLLIREIHHRVKNNLSIIKSMVALQMMNTDHPMMKDAFQDLIDRIVSLSLVHDQLNTGTLFSETLDLKDYLEKLISNIAASRRDIHAERILDIDSEIPPLHLDRITPLGILLNEVITNAYKHAFPGTESPRLVLQARRSGDDLEIEVSDNGPGIDERPSAPDRLGLSLIRSLAQQLGSTLDIRNADGTKVSLRIPMSHSK